MTSHPIDDSVRRCLELLETGEAAEADALLAAALERAPENGLLWQLRGLLDRRQGKLDDALRALETASMLVPLEPPALCALGDCYLACRKLDLARWIYQELADRPDCPTALLAPLASGLGSVGDFERALAVCQEMIRRDPARHEAHFGVAFYRRRLGQPVRDVLPAVRKAQELEPNSTLYRVTLATLLDHLGETEEAFELLRDIDPASIRCCRCLKRAATIFQKAGSELGRETDADADMGAERNGGHPDFETGAGDETETRSP